LLNTLTFKAGTSNYNYISADANNKMYMYANNSNFLNSDGALTNINTDIYSTTTGTNRTFTLESTNVTGYTYLTLKNRTTQAGSIFMGSSYMYFGSDTLTPIRFVINRSSANITAMTIATNGAITCAV
jgi:hypothetical protein